MIRAFVMALVLSLLALPSLAQTVLVRSGEHEGFTRLVLDFPERVAWQTTPRADGIALRFPSRRPVFDLSQAFDRLTQGRLAGVDASDDPGQLNLKFGCACTTRAFWHGRSMLVIDILADAQATEPPEPQAGHPAYPAQFDGARSSLPVPPESVAARLVTSALAEEVEIATPAPSVSPPMQEETLSAMRSLLLEQIAQSANQAVLQPVRPREIARGTAPPDVPLAPSGKSTPANKTSPALAPPRVRAVAQLPSGNLRVQDNRDLGRGAGLPMARPALVLTSCLPDMALDVATWGRQASLPEQLGVLYPGLVGEFDTINADVVRELAQLYIYFGFGLEARQVLNLAPTKDQDILLEMAWLVDDPDNAPTAPRLSELLECSGRSAFWAALAHEVIPEDRLLDHQAILQTFTELPNHLRQHLGPALARKLLVAKHRETSDMILRQLAPADQTATAGETMARAELALAQGDIDTADLKLGQSMARNELHSAEALVKLIDTRLSRNKPITYDTAQLAGAIFQENRGTHLGQRLGRVYLLALAASQSYREAFTEFDRIVSDLPPETITDTRAGMLRLLLLQADDAEFLRQVFNEQKPSFASISADLGEQIAGRVFTLGFADLAAEILGAAKVTEPGPSRRHLKAEILLSQGRPRLAEAELLGLTTPESQALRARSRTALGDHLGAMRHLESLGDVAALHQAAWFAQDWTRLLASSDPSTQKLAEVLMRETPDRSDGLLSYNQRLVDQSFETREALIELLSRTDLSDLPLKR